MENLHIRPAALADLEAINAIYNHYVLTCTCTFQTEPETARDRAQWFTHHGPQHPVVVAEIGDRVVGWGSLSAFAARQAYRHTVEDSIYLHPDMRGRGLGRVLLAELIRLGQELGHHSIVAIIAADQAASLALHAKFGFEDRGHLIEAGFKFGRWLDTVYMQKML